MILGDKLCPLGLGPRNNDDLGILQDAQSFDQRSEQDLRLRIMIMSPISLWTYGNDQAIRVQTQFLQNSRIRLKIEDVGFFFKAWIRYELPRIKTLCGQPLRSNDFRSKYS